VDLLNQGDRLFVAGLEPINAANATLKQRIGAMRLRHYIATAGRGLNLIPIFEETGNQTNQSRGHCGRYRTSVIGKLIIYSGKPKRKGFHADRMIMKNSSVIRRRKQ
jgi:hypothetical protein